MSHPQHPTTGSRRLFAGVVALALVGCSTPTAPLQPPAARPEPAPTGTLTLATEAPIAAGAQYLPLRVRLHPATRWTVTAAQVDAQSVPVTAVDDSTAVVFFPDPDGAQASQLQLTLGTGETRRPLTLALQIQGSPLGVQWEQEALAAAFTAQLEADVTRLSSAGVEASPRLTTVAAERLRPQLQRLRDRLTERTPAAQRLRSLLQSHPPLWLEQAADLATGTATAERDERFRACRISFPDGRACIATGGADLRTQLDADRQMTRQRAVWEYLLRANIDADVVGWLAQTAAIEQLLWRQRLVLEETERLHAPVWPTRLTAAPQTGTVLGGATLPEGEAVPIGVRAWAESLNAAWLRGADTTDWALQQWRAAQAQARAQWAADNLATPDPMVPLPAWPTVPETPHQRMDFTPPLAWLTLTKPEAPDDAWQAELYDSPLGPALRLWGPPTVGGDATAPLTLRLKMQLAPGHRAPLAADNTIELRPVVVRTTP